MSEKSCKCEKLEFNVDLHIRSHMYFWCSHACSRTNQYKHKHHKNCWKCAAFISMHNLKLAQNVQKSTLNNIILQLCDFGAPCIITLYYFRFSSINSAPSLFRFLHNETILNSENSSTSPYVKTSVVEQSCGWGYCKDVQIHLHYWKASSCRSLSATIFKVYVALLWCTQFLTFATSISELIN